MAVMAIALIAFAGSSMAQPACVVGAYTDAAGIESTHTPILNSFFDVFVVMHVEFAVTGLAYSMTWPSHVLPIEAGYGSDGGGLNVPSSGGNNVGLGECALGFNNTPIVVAHYRGFTIAPANASKIILGPNTDESLTSPVYADCADHLLECPGVLDLQLDAVIGTEESSFGAVKSLYGN